MFVELQDEIAHKLMFSFSYRGDVVEDVLTTGMVAKLMHYLRIRTLGEINVETGPAVENRSLTSGRAREEVRGRARMHLDSSRLEENRGSERVGIEKVGTEQSAVDRSSERGADVKGKRKDDEGVGEEKDGRTTVEASDQAGQTYDADEDVEVGEDKRRRKDKGDLKRRGIVSGEWFGHTRPSREEDGEENGRAEPSKRRSDIRDRGGGRGRGKGRSGDGGFETTPTGGVRGGELLRRRSLVDRGNSNFESTSETGKGAELGKEGGSKEVTPSQEAEKEDDEPAPCVMIGKVDVGRIIRTAARAAEAEARAAFAPLEAIKAAGDAATELVKLAATEALATAPEDDAAIEEAAKAAAATVVDAAEAINVNTCREAAAAADPDHKMKAVEEIAETKDHKCELGEKGVCGVEVESLATLRELYCVQCLEKMGEYLEVLGPVLHERGVDVCLALLQRQSKDSSSVKDMTMLSEVLKLICSLAAHRKFASLFVDRGGVQQLLATPRVPLTLIGISLCLFAFASLQGVMERVCTLPPSVVQEIVALGLHLLGCPQDPARRNAALFFGSAFVFRAILDAFEAQDGLSKFLNLLRNAAHLRSGGGSSGGGAAVVSRNDRQLAAEVLTSSGKQIAYHSCVALRQYFRAHLLVLVDSLRPLKGHRGGSRNNSSGRAIYKPADLSNEAMDAIILQLQRDRKLGPSFVKYHWTQLEKFMNYGGHTILLELTQASPNERYLHEISQHALGVLQIVTLMPFTRKLVVGSTLSNERTGMAVILDAASGVGLGYDPEVIQSALLVLVNLVCPPPSLCSRPNLPSSTPGPAHASHAQGPTPVSALPTSSISGSGTAGVNVDSRDRSDRSGKVELATDKNGGDRPAGTSNGPVSAPGHVAPSTPVSSAAGVVGDRRISLGPGAGGSGLAAYMEQGYRYAREAVRANNGIKVLLHLLYPRQLFPPGALDCIRALSCRVLLGLARDNAIAHILTKLQVGKILSELLRDGAQAGRQAGSGGHGEQGRWQAELGRVALELIAIVTNAGRASTMAASEAAAPTLRRIERAAIAAATPISYHSRELLQLIHEHLIASGLPTAAGALLKEARIKPLPSTIPSASIQYSCPPNKCYWEDHEWPGGRVPGGFLAGPGKAVREEEEVSGSASSARKKVPVFSPALVGCPKTPVTAPLKKSLNGKDSRLPLETPNGSGVIKNTGLDNSDNPFKTPTSSRTILPLKRKAGDKDTFPVSPIKRVAQFESGFTAPPFTPPNSRLKSTLMVDTGLPPVPSSSFPVQNDGAVKSVLSLSSQFDKTDTGGSSLFENAGNSDVSLSPCPSFIARYQGTPMSMQVPLSGLPTESRACPAEHTSLDSLVVQYLKHQHRQCPAPITTLPPLSLLHPHVCPEPSRTLDAPLNTTVRLASREVRAPYGGVHGRRHDRHFVYSRFRPWRTCRDQAVLLTATTFLGQASCLAAGSHQGDIRLFDSSSGNPLEVHACHTSPITLLQSAPREIGGGVEGLASHTGQLLLSSAGYDVKLWDSSMMSNGALHTFDICRAARFNHSGSRFGAVGLESPHKEVLLYDVATCKLEHRLSDNSPVVTARGHNQAMVHFSPSDVLVLWSGVLWDHRIPRAIHRFDQFTDYGGGGFHPAGNEIIINSEVWDMRSFKLLRSVQSLDQTTITFNATGDVIYATLRRNSDDIMAALNPRRVRHPLFAAFRTMDAVDYSDIATTPVDRCVLDLATEPTDSFIAVVSMDSNEEMDTFARLYEVGRRRPTDDDSDPDDGGETEDEDSEADDDDEDDDGDLHGDVDDSDIDLASNDDDDDGSADDDDDVDDDVDVDFGDTSDDDGSDDGLGGNILELITEGEDGMTRRTFSSDEGSGGDFGDDAFDDMLHQLMSLWGQTIHVNRHWHYCLFMNRVGPTSFRLCLTILFSGAFALNVDGDDVAFEPFYQLPNVMELYVSFRAISDTAFIELRLRLGEKGPPIFKEFFQAFGGFIPRNEEFFASSVYLQWGGKPSEHRIFARVPSFNEDFRRFGVYAHYF
ncbi:hypothetical protein AXG93_1231s1020 [Marchantia polymorpha subsp. ruderalis]|uniref:Uncharacterized protein n=1 Tax=Marchantia polymorpha subsp. ruderalis TaxID=1480154 RepID=A0A176VPZ8_MARPO|nr:hypothetical protein AXG93_1231s1020 [Marchantia polymorpha subsp. ruderalis]